MPLLSLQEQVPTRQKYPFFQSYGVNWSSSLRVDHPSALGYSPRPPVSVSGTGTSNLARGFSWQCGIKPLASPEGSTCHIPRLICVLDLPGTQPIYADVHHMDAGSILLRYPIADNGWEVVQESLCLLSITYAFRPRLRVRLTPGGITCPGNPWTFGGKDSRLPYRY